MKNELLGMLATALSVLVAAVVSGLRLKPYLDAGETYTPAAFMLYPALAAIAVAGPLVFFLRKVQGKKDIEIGPLVFKDRTSFMALWCLLYVVIALTFFPYDGPDPEDRPPAAPDAREESAPLNQPIALPFGSPERESFQPSERGGLRL